MKNKNVTIFKIILLSLILTGCSDNIITKKLSVSNNSISSNNISDNTVPMDTINSENTNKKLLTNQLSDSNNNIPVTLPYSEIDIDKLVTLGKYKNIVNISSNEITATEEDIKNEIDYYLESYIMDYTKISEGNIKEGDGINVNYSLNIDGQVTNYESTNIYIGYESIAPGIDSSLIGKSVGSINKFDIKYPKDYYDKNLADKNASIEITINYILGEAIKGEWNNEFVKSLTNGEYSSTDDFIEVIKESIVLNKKTTYSSKILEKVIKNTKISGDISDLILIEINKEKEDFKKYSELYGIEMKEIITMYGCENEEEFDKYIKKTSEDSIKKNLVILKLSKEFGIIITNEEYLKYKEELLKSYTKEEVDALYTDDSNKLTLLYDKVTEKLIEFQIK